MGDGSREELLQRDAVAADQEQPLRAEGGGEGGEAGQRVAAARADE